MATTSKFIQLSSSVLLEYIYADQSAINEASNPYRLSTTNDPIWISKNDHNSEDIIFNADSSKNIQLGLPLGTGNVRDRAYAYVDRYKSALLDIDKLTFYNDFDSSLTPTASLPITFSTEKAPVYDTIKIHLIQGFNFEQYTGLTFNIKAKNKKGKNFNLLNLVYNKTDSFEVNNPDSFFFAGKVYDTYLEVRVLSLYNLIYDYWVGGVDTDSVVYKITRTEGIQRDQQIQIYFSWIRDRKIVDEQEYIYLYDTVSVDIPIQDQFESIAAKIQESDEFDYIEFYATYKGNIIENFITNLNQNGYDFILLHDLVVSEYIYDSIGASYYWQKTDELQISQSADYDLPNRFRPVIKNNSAIAFKIDYVVRLYNREDNSQIWKNSSMVSYSAAKYGKKLLQINLGDNPVQSTIYNKNYIKDVQINRIVEPVLDNYKYITSFIDSTQVSVSVDNTTGTENIVGSSNPNIYSNGLARILISDSITYLKFVIYAKDKSGNNTPLNLSGIGQLIISFTSDTGESLNVYEYPSTFTSKTSGEIIFRLTQNESTTVLNYTNRQFKIYLVNEKEEKTFLYNGRFYNQSEWLVLGEINKIAELEQMVSDLTNKNTTLSDQVNAQSGTISNLNQQIIKLVSDDMKEDSIMRIQKDTIDNLNEQVKTLNDSLKLSNSKLLSDQGMISTLRRQLSGFTTYNSTQQTISKTQKEKDLESVSANIKNTPSTTYLVSGGGGANSYIYFSGYSISGFTKSGLSTSGFTKVSDNSMNTKTYTINPNTGSVTNLSGFSR